MPFAQLLCSMAMFECWFTTTCFVSMSVSVVYSHFGQCIENCIRKAINISICIYLYMVGNLMHHTIEIWKRILWNLSPCLSFSWIVHANGSLIRFSEHEHNEAAGLWVRNGNVKIIRIFVKTRITVQCIVQRLRSGIFTDIHSRSKWWKSMHLYSYYPHLRYK